MNAETLTIGKSDAQKLLASANGDAAILYIYVHCDNSVDGAESNLHMSKERFSNAATILRQLGLWQEQPPKFLATAERPMYSESDVIHAMDSSQDFRSLYGEIQRLLGRSLNTEELKILLGLVNYLGLSADVISVLVCYCKDRARQQGNLRNPSLRTIEKEAYAWAEQGIDTVEKAAAFIQNQNQRNSRLAKLMNILQIRGRNLTNAEEKYAKSWLEMGFSDEAISMAYEKTCLNTGGLNWAYMNKILCRWHEFGYHTAEQIRTKDKKPGQKTGTRTLDAEEIAAIARMMKEG